jgi:hypothetical protein
VLQYFSIGLALMVLGRTVHYLAVTRYLREQGLVAPAGGSSIRDWIEWAAYRKARLSDHQSLTWWYVLWTIQVVLLFWLIGWFGFGVGFVKMGTPTHLAQTTADADGYTTVFDVVQSGYRQWSFAAFGLIFVAVGLALPTFIRIGIFQKPPAWMQTWFPRAFLGFAILWTLGAFLGTFVDYRRAVDALQKGEAKVVEGPVAHYWQVPQKSESFDVQGVKFWYSDGVITAGFNHTASQGGPIRDGLPVKIWHWHGEILRLQIKKRPSQSLQPTAGRSDIPKMGLQRFHCRLGSLPPAVADLGSR